MQRTRQKGVDFLPYPRGEVCVGSDRGEQLQGQHAKQKGDHQHARYHDQLLRHQVGAR